MLVKQIWTLLWKDIRIEWKSPQTFNALLLYILNVVMICYLGFGLRVGQIGGLTWVVLFWIMILFAATNAITKSFLQESDKRNLYYYTLANPLAVLIAKLIYNAFILIVVGGVGLVFYVLMLGNPILDMLLFSNVFVLGCISIANTLTMISAIASKTQQSLGMTVVLGFPIIIPTFLMLLKASKNALDGLAWTTTQDELMTLLAINMIVIIVSLVLFPYLWRL